MIWLRNWLVLVPVAYLCCWGWKTGRTLAPWNGSTKFWGPEFRRDDE